MKKTIKFLIFSALFSMAATRPATDYFTAKNAITACSGGAALLTGAIAYLASEKELIERCMLTGNKGHDARKYLEAHTAYIFSHDNLVEEYSSPLYQFGDFVIRYVQFHYKNTGRIELQMLRMRSPGEKLLAAIPVAGISAYCTYKLLSFFTDNRFACKRVTNKIPTDATTY